MKDYKRTNKKVEVKNGTTWFTRTVYIDNNGREFFKHNGNEHYIYKDDRRGFWSPWYNDVRYIEEV